MKRNTKLLTVVRWMYIGTVVFRACAGDWYVAPWGGEVYERCGATEQDPCRSLKDVIYEELYYHGEFVYILSDEEPTVVDICFHIDDEMPIDVAVFIVGVGLRPTFTCTGETAQYAIFNIAHIEDIYYFSVDNIHFEQSSIMSRDANLMISNCSFDFTTIFLTDRKVIDLYLDPDTIASDLGWHLFGIQQETVTFDIYFAEVYITDSYWFYHNVSIDDLRVDNLPRGGIASFSEWFKGTIINCHFNNQFLHFFSSETFDFEFINSSIVGPDAPPLLPGGLKLHFCTSPRIIIQNSIFRNLKFSDYAVSVMYKTYNLQEGAVFLFTGTVSLDTGETGGFDRFGIHVRIINCIFSGNFRAISYLCATVKQLVSMEVVDTEFRNNEYDNDGGAISIFSRLVRVSVNFTNCHFYQNKAGGRPFHTPIHVLNTTIATYYKMMIFSFDYISSKHTNLLIGTIISNVSKTQLLQLESVASGGALYLTTVDAYIENCTFVGNSANDKGGSILLAKGASAEIFNTKFVTDSVDHRSTEGLVITSFGMNLKLKEISVEVLAKVRTSSSVITHVADYDVGSVYGIRTTDVSITCPVNDEVQVQTSSFLRIDVTDTANSEDDTYVTYKDLTYSCAPCGDDQYMLDYGYYSIRQRAQNATNSLKEGMYETNDRKHIIDYPNVQCHSCPWGGICNGTVRSKPNHWGTVHENRLHFFRCPTSYCCSKPNCEGISQCTAHRTGILCGRCEIGFSEAVFSVRCIDNSECKDSWIIPFSFLLACVYSSFLLFQKDIKDFLFGKPLGRRTFIQTVNALKFAKSAGINITDKWHTNKQEEGGIFLILLFYYFQDASIIHFKPIYAESDSSFVAAAKQIVGGLFKFRLDVLHFAKSVCAFPDLGPVPKLLLKLLFVPLLFGILFVIYLAAKRLSEKSRAKPFWHTLSNRAATAVILALLFSYQKVASALFNLVFCVPVLEKQVLFVDGNFECMQHWQIFTVAYIATCIIPFSGYIAFMPSQLTKGIISMEAFFIGCLFPLPVIFYFYLKLLYRQITSTDKISKQNSHISSVYKILQGPYRDLTIPFTDCSYCWSGVLLCRRLLLILVYTFIHDIMISRALMLAICLISLLHHVVVKPCKEQRANIAGTISCAALLIVSIVNMVHACFEGMETIPTGSALVVSDWLDVIEDSLLLWIPLAGIAAVFLILLGKIASKLFSFISLKVAQNQKKTKIVPLRE